MKKDDSREPKALLLWPLKIAVAELLLLSAAVLTGFLPHLFTGVAFTFTAILAYILMLLIIFYQQALLYVLKKRRPEKKWRYILLAGLDLAVFLCILLVHIILFR